MRQAVVLIHGIGEQRPMSTLRSFVDAVLSQTDNSPSTVYSKPDLMSKTCELRRLVVEKSRSRPMTDFFEYYWAHHMDGTKLWHLWPWLRGILLRSRRSVPDQLKTVWEISWLLVVGIGILYVLRLQADDSSKTTYSLSSLVLSAVFLLFQGFAINYLGDAARYLSPLPSNISVRHKIRSEGIELLMRLHQSGHYDRIILVGHSLGGVIGYDILTHVWPQYNTSHAHSHLPRQRSLEQLESLGKNLSSSPSSEEIEAFQQAQRAIWLEQRQLGFPWLVTDFVTLGCPLAHAEILLAKDSEELEARQKQRELPCCPPVADGKGYSFRVNYKLKEEADVSTRSIRVLHHAAQFAPTRWVNLYFPVKFGLLGDLVGGPLRQVFGPGIVDIPVTDGWAQFAPLLSHTHYWRKPATPELFGPAPALAALCGALSLSSTNWLPKAPQSTVASDRPNVSDESA